MPKNTDVQNNNRVVSVLTEIAYYYKLLGDKWRAKAFSNAAQIIKDGGDEYHYGIGEKIRKVITEVRKGISPSRLVKLEKQVKLISDLEKVMGIGPKKAKEFVSRGVKSLTDLRLIPQNELTHMQRLGLAYLDDLSKKIPRETVRKIANKVMAGSGIGDWNLVGSWRRGNATSSDVDILISGKNFPKVEKKAGFISYIVNGPTRKSFLMRDNTGTVRQIDLRAVAKNEYPTALLYFTGSRGFNIAIRSHAKKKGLKLNEYGLFRGKKRINVAHEKDVFEKLGLPFIKPEARENVRIE